MIILPPAALAIRTPIKTGPATRGQAIQDRLAGVIRRPDGTVVTGPQPPAWKGLNKPFRQDRRWATAWSPEQIANRIRLDFPDDESMRISHGHAPRTGRKGTSLPMSCSPSVPRRPQTAPFPGIGRAT